MKMTTIDITDFINHTDDPRWNEMQVEEIIADFDDLTSNLDRDVDLNRLEEAQGNVKKIGDILEQIKVAISCKTSNK